MTNTKLLEFYIKKSGLKKAYIAEKIGLSAVGFRNCMVNRAEFRSSHIRKLCELLGIDDPVTVWAVFLPMDVLKKHKIGGPTMQAWTPSETRSGYTMTTLQRGAATIVLYRPVLSEKERARREKQIQENLGRCMRDYLNRRNKP